jgi:hypothetical protein
MVSFAYMLNPSVVHRGVFPLYHSRRSFLKKEALSILGFPSTSMFL